MWIKIVKYLKYFRINTNELKFIIRIINRKLIIINFRGFF